MRTSVLRVFVTCSVLIIAATPRVGSATSELVHAPASYTFMIQFKLNQAPSGVSSDNLAAALSDQLSANDVAGMIYKAVDPEDEKPGCGHEVNCDVVTVRSSPGGSNEPLGVAMVLTFEPSAAPGGHGRIFVPARPRTFSCKDAATDPHNWGGCVDLWVRRLRKELQQHITDRHSTLTQE